MKVRRLPLALLAPVSLLLLVVALGALQYRWVGQVSEAEREQLKQSLDRRSREFAEDFDREIGRAYAQFQPAPGFSPATPDRFVQQFDEWHSSARFPGLLKTAYVAAREGDGMSLQRYSPDTDAFGSVEWPAVLASVQNRLKLTSTPIASVMPGATGSVRTNFVITALPVLPEIPAIVIPVPVAPSAQPQIEAVRIPGGSAMFTMPIDTMESATSFVVLELDREYLASTVVPALAERHFPAGDADRFRIAVVDGKSQLLHSRGLSGSSLEREAADATIPFFGLRVDATMRGVVSAASAQMPKATMMWSARGTGSMTPAPGQVGRMGRDGTVVITRPPDQDLRMVIEQHAASVSGKPITGSAARTISNSGWTLLLQHGAGSLDAAVERVRARNLWLSFGILGVLAASTGLVLINARRSEKLAAQQMDFVATVSHELRTPVAVIRSAAQNLSAGVVHEPEQAKRYGELIESEGRRLTDMVEQVLEYAGLSDAKRLPAPRPVDAGRVVRDVVNASESLPEAGRVTFEVRIDEGAPAVLAEEDSIRRALLNLVGNALKYGSDGGWIGVTVSRGTGRDDGHVLVSVSDRGRGIPSEDLPNIFKPFYRGEYARERQIHGNGLGLSLVKRIAEAHGGRVSVTSAPDEGSTFTLALPVTTEVPGTTPALAEPTQPAPGRSL